MFERFKRWLREDWRETGNCRYRVIATQGDYEVVRKEYEEIDMGNGGTRWLPCKTPGAGGVLVNIEHLRTRRS